MNAARSETPALLGFWDLRRGDCDGDETRTFLSARRREEEAGSVRRRWSMSRGEGEVSSASFGVSER